MNRTITVTPNLAASGVGATTQYGSGDCMGILNTVSVPGVTSDDTITAITVIDLAKQNAAFDVLVWVANPSGTTFTNNTALDVADTDATIAKLAGHVSVLGAHYASYADNSSASLECWLPLDNIVTSGGDAGSLYVALVCRGTPTYAAAGDISVGLKLSR